MKTIVPAPTGSNVVSFTLSLICVRSPFNLNLFAVEDKLPEIASNDRLSVTTHNAALSCFLAHLYSMHFFISYLKCS